MSQGPHDHLHDPVRRVTSALSAAPPVAPGRRVLAVDGRSGAGKSALAAAVAEALRGSEVSVTGVALDELYPGWDGLEAGVEALLDGVLRPFAAGAAEVVLRRWDWTAHRPGPVERRPCGSVLVVEGAGCGALRCAAFTSLLVLLEAPDDVRKARALARDGATYAPHWDRWAAQEQAHYARERTAERAAIRLSTAD